MFQISSNHTVGGVLLKSPSLLDVDQREMFCSYLFPGNQQNEKVNYTPYFMFVLIVNNFMEGNFIDGKVKKKN